MCSSYRGEWIEFCNLYFYLPLEGVPVGGGWIPVKLYFKIKHYYHILKIIFTLYPPPPLRGTSSLPTAGRRRRTGNIK